MSRSVVDSWSDRDIPVQRPSQGRAARAWMLCTWVVAVAGCRHAAPAAQELDTPSVSSVGQAELVLDNGTIITLDADLPEVQALAVRAGRIVALGESEEIAGWIGPDTQVVDLAGATAIPGFIEGHGHFLRMGQMASEIDLRQVDSWAGVVARVREAVAGAEPGAVVYGRGWHQEKWSDAPSRSVDEMPAHDDLSAVSPDNPVVLVHASGHATLVNSAALQAAAIEDATPNPPGGEIVRDASGRATGALRETAARLVAGLRAERDTATLQRYANSAAQACLENGVTGFQDAGTSLAEIEVLRAMAQAGQMPVRLWMMVRDTSEGWRQRLAGVRTIGAYDHHFTVRAIKHSVDGALGSHGAWLLEPYSDDPETTGLNTTDLAEIEASARAALEHDFQMCVHAIGDRGNREILDLYRRVLGPDARSMDHRWRIEHAQHLHPRDVPRFAGMGVVASMQTVHCTSDAPWVEPRLGPQRAEQGAYLWRQLIEVGALVSNGTDVPVEDIDPIANYHAAVTRQTAAGWRFFESQAMTRLEALKSTTINAAKAAFDEAYQGSLHEGKFADITILSQNILQVPEDEIPGTRVQMTIVGGEILYAAN